jgi:hypothetical protein
VVRETGKIKAPDRPFGSVLAYTLPPIYPVDFKRADLPLLLRRMVESLGFHWGYFMVDYIIRDGSPVFLECTPRPGGDSIPDLLEHGPGIDVLGVYLDFVQGRAKDIGVCSGPSQAFASVNLYSPCEGRVVHIDPARALREPHVRALRLKKKEGDFVVLPPADYDNRLIGYCIIENAKDLDLVSESQRLLDLLDLSIDEEGHAPRETD